MARYLISVTETYRADTEQEALTMIDDARKSSEYTLIKYSSLYKEKKQKGEVVDCWWKVTLTKGFDDEKEPTNNMSINYERESAF